MQKNSMAAEYTEFTLYDGKVKGKFYPQSHQYWISIKGSPYKRKSGSTTFIGIKDKSTPLGIWQQTMTLDFLLTCIEKGVKIDEDKCIESVIQNDIAKDEAIDIGKEMHDWLEKYALFKLKDKRQPKMPDMPQLKEAITGINSFLEWESGHKIKYISPERVVYSIKHDYMGTLDLEAEVDGMLCLVDYKSSNGLYNTVRAQTASYVKADEEEYGKKKYQGRWALRFSKYTEKEYLKRENRKKILKAHICRIKGKDFKDYEIAPYVAFEAKFLDKEKSYMNDDFEQGFLSSMALYRWDQKTDWYKNSEY